VKNRNKFEELPLPRFNAISVKSDLRAIIAISVVILNDDFSKSKLDI